MSEENICHCECHKGKHLYHVRWKPCCATPVDGGTPAKVWGCTMKNEEVHFLIAKDPTEVAKYWREEFGYDPIDDSVGEAKAPA